MQQQRARRAANIVRRATTTKHTKESPRPPTAHCAAVGMAVGGVFMGVLTFNYTIKLCILLFFFASRFLVKLAITARATEGEEEKHTFPK